MAEPEKLPEAIPLDQTAQDPPAKPKRARGRKPQVTTDEAETTSGSTPATDNPGDGPWDGPDIFDQVIADEVAKKGRVQELLSKSHRKHPNLNCIFVDAKAGIRLDREEERLPGEPSPRLLITFAEGKLPNKDETSMLHAEGFRFNNEDKAWWKYGSPANQHISKIAINKLLEMRGFEVRIAVPHR